MTKPTHRNHFAGFGLLKFSKYFSLKTYNIKVNITFLYTTWYSVLAVVILVSSRAKPNDCFIIKL